MKKFTKEELINMDSEELKNLREKCWDADYILNFQKERLGIKLYSSDVARLLYGGLKTTAIIGAAYLGYRAVKYYVDRKYKEDDK